MLRLLPLLAVSGCAAATLQTARTNGKGAFQAGIEPGVWVVTGAGAAIWVPSLNVSGRYGVSDRVDIGARVGTTLYEFQTKFALTDPAALDSIAFALAPSTTVFGFGGGGSAGIGSVFYWDTHVPFLKIGRASWRARG